MKGVLGVRVFLFEINSLKELCGGFLMWFGFVWIWIWIWIWVWVWEFLVVVKSFIRLFNICIVRICCFVMFN